MSREDTAMRLATMCKRLVGAPGPMPPDMLLDVAEKRVDKLLDLEATCVKLGMFRDNATAED